MIGRARRRGGTRPSRSCSWTPPLTAAWPDPSVLCGTIDEITRDGLSIIGPAASSPTTRTALAPRRSSRIGRWTSNSIDGGDVEWEFIVEEVDEDGWPIKGLDLMTR
jgi:hypothetical protein